MKIVIRAGGIGTRLWPVSRQNKPKQLHALITNKTLLQESIEQAMLSAKVEDIYISGNVNYENLLRNELGAVLENNLIIEPSRQETTAAIGLECIYISKKDPQAIIASIGSDHSIKNKKEFARLLNKAEKTLQKQPHKIICLGIKPRNSDTGYGYIKMGKKVSEELFQVENFYEKPNAAKAQEFFNQGDCLWNANIFIWRVDMILKLYDKYVPKMYRDLLKIKQAIGKSGEKAVINKIYPRLEKIAIDYAIIEKAKNILVIPADIGWSDIGDWARLKDELAASEEENVIKANHLGFDTKNSIVYSETKKLIATIGLENIIIVDTSDALLVCDKYRSAEIKKIVEELKKRKKNKYL